MLVVGGRETLIDVDAVAGYHEMVVRPLGPQLASLGLFSGGCVLADGRRVLVLDPSRLSVRAPPRREAGAASRSRSGRPLALIVDDSPTQRARLELALASLGVRTRTARDGIEALERLALARPDVLIVDIDMPRLDGFGLLAAIAGRDDPVDDGYAGPRRPSFDERGPPPGIVVSSRSSGQDRRRARELGASRFIAKPGSTGELRAALRDCGVIVAGP